MDLEQEARRRVGTTLCNAWTLDRLIGTGGMAAVYEATDKTGRRDAIKILHADVARDPEMRARFEQEAQAVSHFIHPGTVEVRGVDVSEDGAPFMVMELLDGEPLSELARKPGGVTEADLLRLVDELLDVLAAAHAQGIIHRDVKPDNLFVLRDGHLKVLDFGVARVRAGRPDGGPPHVPMLQTRAGAALGTAPYMPPEQIKGEEIDARADLFAVGATMFRLLAKRRVHEAEGDTQMLLKMASEPAPSLAAVAPELPRDLCLVVDRALMFDRASRYPDAITMQGDVRALREGRPPPYASAHAGDAANGAAPRASREPSTVVVPASANDAPTRTAITGTEPTTAMAAVTEPAPSQPAVPASASRLPAVLAPAPVATSDPAPIADTLRPGPIVQADTAPVPSSAVPTPEPTTRPMTQVPVHDEPPPHAPSPGYAPGAERTMRSQGVIAPVKATGFVVTPEIPMARPAGAVRGPPTQPTGVAPLAPGESIQVVAPSRRAPDPSQLNLLPLVLVGVLFAGLGVGLTLWIMLKDGAAETTAVAPTATVEPSNEPASDGRPWPLRAPSHATPPPRSMGTAPGKPHPKAPHAK
jgi:eukaryotic-like serine/threonine-protein kinase